MKNRIIIQLMMAIVISLFGTKVYAYDIAIKNADGVTIYYNYVNEGRELEVTYGTEPHYGRIRTDYSGEIVIPEEVTYMDRTLKVTSLHPHYPQ